MSVRVVAVGRSDLAAYEMPARFRHDIAYFMSIPGQPGMPALGEGEYWIDLGQARGWLEDGFLPLVSPLDSQHRAQVELTEDQEAWLEWLVQHDVQHVRLE
jgi:hypothetical protein